jgi:hypothetical protein
VSLHEIRGGVRKFKSWLIEVSRGASE